MAEVRGQITGDVINRGRLELSGMIVGSLHDHSGNSEIDPNAEILQRKKG